MILAMDARNGDFLAYAGVPTFNPNTYAAFPAENRINRPATVAYEPGSVFKIFSVSILLELGGISELSEFECDGFYEHPDIPKPIKCLGVHGIVGPREIIMYSCNAGAAYASESANPQAYYDLVKAFGFGDATDIPFPGESNGLLEPPSRWSPRTKPTMAFGQEISTSAVQVATAATVFANDGVLLRPNIVKKIVSPEGKVIESFGRETVRRVLSRETAVAMLSMMEEATQVGGTAYRASVDGIRVSAKTGTAQVFNVETGQYSDETFVASCIAIFPTDDPQIIVYVVIQHPRAGETFGGRIAAPVASEMIAEIAEYLGIPRVGDTIVEHSGTIAVKKRATITIGDTMPDLLGYSKRELLPLLGIDDINLSITGDGWVVRQSPSPGAPVPRGTTIELVLE